MMTLSKRDFALRPETTLGQIWETVRQWILNSPYSKFKKEPRTLPTKICEGEFEWCANETKDDLVTLSRAGDGMTVISSRIRRGLKWNTVLKFTRLKRLVKGAAEMHIEGSIPEGAGEAKAPRVVRQLLKTYGIEKVRKRKVSVTAKSVAKTTRKKTVSKSKDWNQTLAAKMLGISTRQLRNYAKNPPDEHWPGWEDAILLKQWKNARDDRDKMNRTLANSLGYMEGFSEAFKRK